MRGHEYLKKQESQVHQLTLQVVFFFKAHNKANSQSIVYQKMYDKMGEETQDINNAVKVEWFVSKRGINKIIQTLP